MAPLGEKGDEVRVSSGNNQDKLSNRMSRECQDGQMCTAGTFNYLNT